MQYVYSSGRWYDATGGFNKEWPQVDMAVLFLQPKDEISIQHPARPSATFLVPERGQSVWIREWAVEFLPRGFRVVGYRSHNDEALGVTFCARFSQIVWEG